MSDFTMLLLQKYGYKVCVILFHYKTYIHLPCVNTQQITTEPFNITHVISCSDRQTTILCQGSIHCCEGDCRTNIIRLLQPSQTSHYCNKSVLSIVTDLNIFIWSIAIFDLFLRSALVQFFSITCYLFVSLDGAKVLHIWFVTGLLSYWSPLSLMIALYCYYKNIVLRFVWYRLVFDHLVWKFIFTYASLTHSDEEQHKYLCDWHSHEWVYYFDTTQIWF